MACFPVDVAHALFGVDPHDLLAWQAMQWRDSHSARQSERRIKHYSGRSLREWRTLVKTEGALFAALQGHAAGLPLDLAALAHEQGFADQAHLSRATKRITGFSPAESPGGLSRMNRFGCIGCGCDAGSTVDFAALAQAQHQHTQYLVFDLADHPHIAHPIAP